MKQFLFNYRVVLYVNTKPYSLPICRCLDVASECSRDEAVMLTTCLLPEFNISVLTYLVEVKNSLRTIIFSFNVFYKRFALLML